MSVVKVRLVATVTPWLIVGREWSVSTTVELISGYGGPGAAWDWGGLVVFGEAVTTAEGCCLRAVMAGVSVVAAGSDGAGVSAVVAGRGGATAIRGEEQPVDATALTNSANPEAQAFVVRTCPG
jgi:hypothetical protein